MREPNHTAANYLHRIKMIFYERRSAILVRRTVSSFQIHNAWLIYLVGGKYFTISSNVLHNTSFVILCSAYFILRYLFFLQFCNCIYWFMCCYFFAGKCTLKFFILQFYRCRLVGMNVTTAGVQESLLYQPSRLPHSLFAELLCCFASSVSFKCRRMPVMANCCATKYQTFVKSIALMQGSFRDARVCINVEL